MSSKICIYSSIRKSLKCCVGNPSHALVIGIYDTKICKVVKHTKVTYPILNRRFLLYSGKFIQTIICGIILTQLIIGEKKSHCIFYTDKIIVDVVSKLLVVRRYKIHYLASHIINCLFCYDKRYHTCCGNNSSQEDDSESPSGFAYLIFSSVPAVC